MLKMGSITLLLLAISTFSTLVPLVSSEKEVDPCVVQCIKDGQEQYVIAENSSNQETLGNLSHEFKSCLYRCPPSEFRNESIYIGISPVLLATANNIESFNGLLRDCSSNETDQSNSKIGLFSELLFNCSKGKFRNSTEVIAAMNPTATRYQLSNLCKYTKCAIIPYITMNFQSTCNGTTTYVEFGTKILKAQVVSYLYQYHQFKTGNGTFDVDFFPCRCKLFFDFL